MTGARRIAQKASARIPTAEGEFQLHLYHNGEDTKEHLALVLGEVADRENVLVRVHSECFTGDVFGSLRCDCGAQLDQALMLIAREGAGIIIYLRQEGRGIGLLKKLRAYNLQDEGYDTIDANLMLGHEADEREYSAAALILKDLAVRSIRLLTNNPNKINCLRQSGFAVTSRVPLQPIINAQNANYLWTKATRMFHELNIDLALIEDKKNAEANRRAGDEASDHNGSNHEAVLGDLLKKASGHRQRTGRPFVTLSYAQSLDGCIALDTGEQLSLSCAKSLLLTHKLRAIHDSILVGIGTVLSDNPSLTTRLVQGKNPRPIVLDSKLRIPTASKLINCHRSTFLVATSEHADYERQRALETEQGTVLRLPTNEKGQVRISALLEKLAELEINTVMVEGGARIITSFLSEKLADYVILTVAPMVIGGLHAIDKMDGKGSASLPRLRGLRCQKNEEDIVLWGEPVWERD